VTPTLELLEDRSLPSIASPQVVVISLGNDRPGRDQAVTILAQQYLSVGQSWGVNNGTVIRNVTLPSLGSPVTQSQLMSLLTNGINTGTLPAPNDSTIYLIFGNAPDAEFNYQGYHTYFNSAYGNVVWGFVYPLGFNSECYVASHELIEAAVDPFVNGSPEVADPFNNQYFLTSGIWSAIIENPGGQAMVGSNLTETAALNALPIEQFYATAWGFIAHFLPWFAPQATASAQQLNSNPMANTPLGENYQAAGLSYFNAVVFG
jgi:hypothetical protein